MKTTKELEINQILVVNFGSDKDPQPAICKVDKILPGRTKLVVEDIEPNEPKSHNTYNEDGSLESGTWSRGTNNQLGMTFEVHVNRILKCVKDDD